MALDRACNSQRLALWLSRERVRSGLRVRSVAVDLLNLYISFIKIFRKSI